MKKSKLIISFICTGILFTIHCKKSQNESDIFVIALSNRVKIMPGSCFW